MRFKAKNILLTGASSGIGEALAYALSKEGAQLILVARRQAELERVAAACSGQTIVLPADLYDPKAVAELAQKALSLVPKIDIVIHAAGVSQRAFTEETEPAVIRQLMQLNFFAPAELTQALLTHFKEAGGGQVVFLNSVAGLFGVPLRSGYAAAKHALKGFAESLQTEGRLPGLRVCSVYAGRIRTPISMSALTGNGSPHGRMDAGQLSGMPAAKCAQKILRGMARGQSRIIIAQEERILWWLWFFLPRIYARIARRQGTK